MSLDKLDVRLATHGNTKAAAGDVINECLPKWPGRKAIPHRFRSPHSQPVILSPPPQPPSPTLASSSLNANAAGEK